MHPRRVLRIHRAAPSLVALLSFLGASWSDARGIDPCPHHDRLPGALSAAGHEHGAIPGGISAGADGAMDASMHGAAEGSAPGPAPGGSHADHGPCKCMGCCAVGGTPALASRAPTVSTLPQLDVRVAPAPPATRAAHRVEPDWSSHLPNAPPLPV